MIAAWTFAVSCHSNTEYLSPNLLCVRPDNSSAQKWKSVLLRLPPTSRQSEHYNFSSLHPPAATIIQSVCDILCSKIWPSAFFFGIRRHFFFAWTIFIFFSIVLKTSILKNFTFFNLLRLNKLISSVDDFFWKNRENTDNNNDAFEEISADMDERTVKY